MTTSSGGCAREKINEPFSQLAGPTKREKKKGEKCGIIYSSPSRSHPFYGERPRPCLSSSLFFACRRSGSRLTGGCVLGTERRSEPEEDKASTCLLARFRKEMRGAALLPLCPHGLVSSTVLLPLGPGVPTSPGPSGWVGRPCTPARCSNCPFGNVLPSDLLLAKALFSS